MSNKEFYDKWTAFTNNEKYKKYFMTNEKEWNIKLDEVKNYISKYNKKPSICDKDINIKQLGQWILTQQKNYVNDQHIMKDNNIRNKWKQFIDDIKYKQYFLSNEEEWDIKLEEVKKYIDDNKKKPAEKSKDKIIKQLGSWISRQQNIYAKEQYIMKDENIRNRWKQFIEDPKYKQYFKF
jgi:HKD family nuclease